MSSDLPLLVLDAFYHTVNGLLAGWGLAKFLIWYDDRFAERPKRWLVAGVLFFIFLNLGHSALIMRLLGSCHHG